MLCTTYEELNDAVPYIVDAQDAVDFCEGIYTAYCYKALCDCIRKSRKQYSNKKLYKYTALSNRVTNYTIFHGEDPTELKNFYHKCIEHFGWKAVQAIEDECIFGKAYINALRYAGNNDQAVIPTAKLVFEELSKLLKKYQYAGFEIAEDAKEYLQ